MDPHLFPIFGHSHNMAYAMRNSRNTSSRSNYQPDRHQDQVGHEDLPHCFCTDWLVLQHESDSLKHGVPVSEHVIHSDAQGEIYFIPRPSSADIEERPLVP